MPNKKGGKGYKKGRKGVPQTRELVIKENKENEEYAFVKSKSGNGRFVMNCQDGIERIGIISGKMRKRVWIEVGVLVLIVKWDFQDSKCNIIHKYDDSDIIKLSDMKELDSIFITNNKVESNFNEEYDDYDISDEEDSNSSETEENDDINIDDI